MAKTVFTRDDDNATLTIERSFHAPRERVWQALTDSNLLDQWWAPKPWKTSTVSMDFRVGGFWHYAMNGPDGEQHFGRMNFIAIESGWSYRSSDVFCDAAGVSNESLPSQVMNLKLLENGEQTRIVEVVQYASLKDMETILAMGMQEGLGMALDQLEVLLAKRSL